ncbi:hypothetical protein Q8F55_003789 [Vanrija albida]|uniref:Mif2/CENP-C cupin domain-containing protein n=1 Tax=Vanrija albida TaxID=181172 RepID=A0ABR3Q5Q1_9TREE
MSPKIAATVVPGGGGPLDGATQDEADAPDTRQTQRPSPIRSSADVPNASSSRRRRPQETGRDRLRLRYPKLCIPFPSEPSLTGDDLGAFLPLETSHNKAILSPSPSGPACGLLRLRSTLSMKEANTLHHAAREIAGVSASDTTHIQFGTGSLEDSSGVAEQPGLLVKVQALVARWAEVMARPYYRSAKWDHQIVPEMRDNSATLYEYMKLDSNRAPRATRDLFNKLFPTALQATLAGLGTVLSVSWGAGSSDWGLEEGHSSRFYTVVTVTGGTAELYVKGINRRVRLNPGAVVFFRPSEYEFKLVWEENENSPPGSRFIFTCYTDKLSPDAVSQRQALRQTRLEMTKALEGVGLGGENGDAEGDGGEAEADVSM